jgi:hypothetical protein
VGIIQAGTDLGQLIQKNYDDVQKLGSKMQSAWIRIESSFVEFSLLQKLQYEDNVEFLKKVFPRTAESLHRI